MLRVLMDKIDSMQEQMGDVSGDRNSKNQTEMLEIKSTVTEMKNAFDGLIGRLDMAEEIISELKTHASAIH